MADEHKLSAALQAQVDAAKVANELAQAREAAAKASAAEYDAALAALKAKIGEPAAGPHKGMVETAEGAGLAEISLLARKGLERLAESISEDLNSCLPEGAVVLLTLGDALPDLGQSDALSARISLVQEVAAGARGLSDEAQARATPTPAPSPRGDQPLGAALVTPLAAAGLILGGANALLGYFKTDSKVGGVAISPGDRPLLLALAKLLRTGTRKVFIDGFLPPASEEQRAALNDSFKRIAAEAAFLRMRSATHAAAIAKIDEALAGTPTDPPVGGTTEGGEDRGVGSETKTSNGPAPRLDLDSDPLGDKLAHEQALAACNNAVALFDALASSLYAEKDGVPAIETAARQMTLREALKPEGCIVALKLDGAWGSYISKQGMFSGLGGLPFKVSATAGASWAAFAFPSGELLGCELATARCPLTSLDDID